MANFFGREIELRTLNQFLKKKTASLIVVRGRRRIGKSRLIEEFVRPCKHYFFSGVAPTKKTTAQMQRDEFAFQLGQFLNIPGIKADDWNVLFLLLAKLVENGRVIVVLDEISWMGSKDPNFLGKLKNIWDLHFKKNDELILIICGSASAWIEKNILSSTAFVGRISQSLILEELPINICCRFWGELGRNISGYEKLKTLSVIGGIPKYLEEIDPTLSSEENIKKLCFTKGGFLVDEFNNVFSDLFSRRKNEKYKKILRILSDGAKELKDICNIMNIQQTGRLTEHLNELELSGFIQRDYTWNLVDGQDSKLSHYRLSDNYSRFYLKYIDKYRTKIQRNNFAFKSLTSLSEWYSILGHQFENLVLNNRKLIQKQLGLNGEDIISENPFFQNKTNTQPGCQIDYLIQTKYDCLYVCEIRFSKNTIGSSIIEEVQQKIDRIKRPKGISCRAVLIHANGVHEEVIERSFFCSIIDFSKLLEENSSNQFRS
jgi:AAA+ ATPase superfamily predicted ATPase